jgi:hypothetical protein
MGATYYVDATDGDNGNLGTSEDQAWQTLLYVKTHHSSGDTIKLQCGETWNEDFSLETNNLTVTSYGVGEKPIINKFVFNNGFQDVIVSNLHCRQTGSQNAMQGLAWGRSSYNIIVEDCILDSNGFSGVSVIDISGEDALNYSHDIIFRGCTFIGQGIDENFGCFNIVNWVRDVLVEDCIAYNGGAYNFQVYGSTTERHVYNISFRGCTGYNSVSSGGGGGINIGAFSHDCTVEKCCFYGNGDAGIALDANSYNNTIKNNITYNNVTEMYISNTSYGNKIYNNTFVAGADTRKTFWDKTPELGNTPNTFYNNICVSLKSYYPVLLTKTSTISDYNYFYFDSISLTRGEFSYNGTSYSANPTTVTQAFTDYKVSSGQDSHSICEWTSDPVEGGSDCPGGVDLLFRSSTDYHLTKNSPCIGAGIALPEVTEDYDGNPRHRTPSIGAYEHNKGIIRGNSTIKNATL